MPLAHLKMRGIFSNMTLNPYSTVLPSMQEDCTQKLGKLLTPFEVTDKIIVIKEQAAVYHHERRSQTYLGIIPVAVRLQ
jgi:hypothetical protein